MSKLQDEKRATIMDGSDAEMLQRRMNSVRHELDDNFQEITGRVREFGVWQSYVRSYPWVCLGAAAILGYLMIPRKQKPQVSGISLPAREALFGGLPSVSNSNSHPSVREVAVNFLATAMMRGASDYISKRVGKALEDYHESTREEDAS